MNGKVKQALDNINEIRLGYSETKRGILTPRDICPDDFSIIETALNDYEEHEKELITEQHRLFGLAKEQENELKELKEFARIITAHTKTGGGDYISIHIVCDKGEKDYHILKEVVEKYGKKEE